MIILDERQFISKEFEARGFEVFDFYEKNQILNMQDFNLLELKRRGDLLIVDTQTVLNHPKLHENFKTVLNTFSGAIFFHEHENMKAQDWIKNEGSCLNKVIGEYSLPMTELNWTILLNQLQFYWVMVEDQKKLQKQMAKFSMELDQVLQSAEVEMVKAKEIHEALVPRRNEEIKGIRFSNKYAAGDGGGGEFYDLHQSPTRVFQVLVASQSYLISSAILGVLELYRGKGFNPIAFLKDAFQEIGLINDTKKIKSQVDLLVLELDLVNLTLKSHTDSKTEVYSQVKGKLDLTKDRLYQMERDEKVIVFSTGFIFNWNEGHPEKNIYTFIKDHAKSSSSELISEFFFQLKDGKKSEFLKKDATVVMMEVNRYGIHKV